MTEAARNPGPSWGYAFINGVDRLLPRPVVNALVAAGSVVALCAMRPQRRCSRAFLAEALRRPPTWRDSCRHFRAFARFLMDRFRAANGEEPTFRDAGAAGERVESLARSQTQSLFGTFHFGQSDLMGFWLSKFGLPLRMVRFQVENSADIDWLERRFGDRVGFIWVNAPENMLFALKSAIDAGASIALKCDRAQHSSKLEAFEFLGRRRLFPFTIYHLSALFGLPVVFAFGVRRSDDVIDVHSSSVYRPEAATKAENLAEARRHFQETLWLLESLLATHPYQWFNFQETLPLADPALVGAAATTRI